MLPDRRPILCLVSDRRRLCGSCDEVRTRQCLIGQVRAAVQAGIEMVQIRERDMDASRLATLVTEAMRIARGSDTRIVVNDRLDIAMATGADGVHLREDSVPVAAARRGAPPGFLIGRSVHQAEEAAVVAADADYVIAGTVFATMSKTENDRLLGQAGLTAIVRTVPVPVLAIGGLSIGNISAVAAAGAAGIAAIGLFLSEEAVAGCRSGPLDTVAEQARARFDGRGR